MSKLGILALFLGIMLWCSCAKPLVDTNEIQTKNLSPITNPLPDFIRLNWGQVHTSYSRANAHLEKGHVTAWGRAKHRKNTFWWVMNIQNNRTNIILGAYLTPTEIVALKKEGWHIIDYGSLDENGAPTCAISQTTQGKQQPTTDGVLKEIEEETLIKKTEIFQEVSWP